MARWKIRPEKSSEGQSEETHRAKQSTSQNSSDGEEQKRRPPRWSLGILQDKETDEVPGVLP